MGLSWLKLIGEGQKQTTSFPANTAAPLRAIFRLNNSTLDVLLARAIGITGNRSSRIKFSRLIEDRKQKHSCRNTERWLRRITKENWENWSEVGRGNRFRALAKDPSRRPCFVFCHGVGRKGDGYDAFLRAGKTNVNGTRRNGFERATSIRLPLRSVDGCHRPLVGNSNFKSRFRDYSAGNESVEEKEEEKREREKGKKRRQSRRESNGSVTGGDYSSGISHPFLVDLGKVEAFWASIRWKSWRHCASRDGYRGLELSEERGKFGRFYQSRLVISRCAEKSKGSNFEVESRWISMDSTRGEEDDGRFFPSREDSVELSPGTYGGRRFYPWRLICLRPYDPISSSWGNIEWYLTEWM